MPGVKMWNTQYMESFNKKRIPNTKSCPTVPGRYNNPHPKKNFTDPRPKTAAPTRSYQQQLEYSFQQAYQQYMDDLTHGVTYPSIPNNLATTEELSVTGIKAPMTVRGDQKPIILKKSVDEKEKSTDEEKEKDKELKKVAADIPIQIPTPPKEERSKTPAKDYHWSVWPEPERTSPEPPKRPHTSIGIHRAPTPYGATGDDIEDRPDSPEPSYVFGVHEESARGPPMTFVPELQSWVNASTDYEKDAVLKVMAMNGSLAPPLPPEALRPQRQATFTFGSRRNSTYRPVLDPRGHYAHLWMPYNEKDNITEEERIRQMDKRFHMSESVPQLPRLERSYTDMRPMQRRIIRYPRSQDYIHEHSMFMTTQPLCRGHFIIHPDWVSERMSKRQINLANRKPRNGFQYGGKSLEY